MAQKTIYRAVTIDGIVHGGGGIQQNHWRRSYKQASKDLDRMPDSKLSDNVRYVEAYQMDESKAFEVLHQQGR